MKFKFPVEVRAYIYLTLATAIWGIALPIVEKTLREIPPFSFLALRFLIVGIFVVPVGIGLLRKIKLNKKRIRHLFIAAILGHILALTLYFSGLAKTTTLSASIIYSFMPLAVIIMAWLILQEHIRRAQIEGFLIALIGTIILIIEPIIANGAFSEFKRLSLIGNLLFILGVFSESMYNIYFKKFISRDKIITPFRSVVFIYCICLFTFLPLGLIEQYGLYKKTTSNEESQVKIADRECKVNDYDLGFYSTEIKCNNLGCYFNRPNNINYFCYSNEKSNKSFFIFVQENLNRYFDLKNTLSLFYMAFFSGLLAYYLFSLGLKHISASRASLFYYLQPIFSLPIAIIFIGERASHVYIFGLILVIIGVIVAERYRRK